MDQAQYEDRDERAEMLAALEPEPPFNPADFASDDEPFDDTDQQDAATEPDYKALLREREERIAALEGETAAERQRREATEQRQREYDQQQAQAKQREWEQMYTQAVAHAETLPHREAVQYLAQFARWREQEALTWGQQVYTEKETIRLTNKAEKIAAKHGLPEEEVETLVRAAMTAGGDEGAIEAEAKRLKAREEKYMERVRKVEEDAKRQKAESARQKLGKSPVNRVPAGNRTAPRDVKPGSREQLAHLMGISPR
jgi:hypothetical protein